MRLQNHISGIELIQPAAKVQDIIDRAYSGSTKRTYHIALNQHLRFCVDAGRKESFADAETVGLWIDHLVGSGMKPNTVSLKVYGVSSALQLAGFPNPIGKINELKLKSIRQDAAKAGSGVKEAQGLTAQDLYKIESYLSSDEKPYSRQNAETVELRKARNRALILMGFVGCFRISELLAVDVEAVQVEAGFMCIAMTWSKTSKDGQTRYKQITRNHANRDMCPVQAFQEWLRLSGIESGRVFRSIGHGGQVKQKADKKGNMLSYQGALKVMRSVCKRAGIADYNKYATHSMRRGHAEHALASGADFADVQEAGGWSDTQMPKRYGRKAAAARSTSAKMQL